MDIVKIPIIDIFYGEAIIIKEKWSMNNYKLYLIDTVMMRQPSILEKLINNELN